ncbi:MAG: sugar ABC transporter permease [Lacisediminihabitans sp.]
MTFATKRGRRSNTKLGRRLAPYLFVAPNMLIFAIFIIFPAINGFNISFYNSNNGRTFNFVGFGNYATLVSDADFWSAVRNTLVFVVLFVTLTTWLAILLAVTLNAQVRAKGFFRTVVFLPVLLSPVVIGLLWNWIFDRQNGLLNIALSHVGLGAPGWLVSSGLAMGVTIFVALWTHTGFYTIILLAGLQGIDGNVYEAARLDGAGPFQTLRSITLPLLQPTVFVVIILAAITAFQAYDFIYTLTGGGPIGATTLLVQYIYDHAFQSPIEYGLASAAGVVLFLTVLFATLISFFIGRKREAV